MNTFHNPLTILLLLIFITFTLDFVAALRQLEPPNPDEITKGVIPSRSTVEPEPTKSKYKGKSIGGISGLLGGLSTPTSSIMDNNIHHQATPILSNSINTMPSTRPVSFTPNRILSNEVPKETQNPTLPHSNLENSGIFNGGEIAYSWMVLSVVCAFLIGFIGLLSV
ncbi:15267_t:CDS:1 [Cetraspora pellucida]|uniref:15267_t:CDS:1 n=1 Tax=Cetraspora pellucida TaxID=1433469 RepID=A0ACA9LRP9_9GLOM|nr:15267_t:CDS:1 [Cetraspora pellucida]